MEKSPHTHPCRSCLQQVNLEKYQRIRDKRATFISMGIPTGPLGCLDQALEDIRDLYCDGCIRVKQHMKAIDDDGWKTYPQDDNHYIPQYEDIDNFELAGIL